MKKLFLISVILLVSGCIQQDANTALDSNKPAVNSAVNAQVTNANGVDGLAQVEKGDVVKVEYVGTFPDTGEVFDKSEGRGPLEFEAGAGQMIKGFDLGVIGMKLNEEKTITVLPQDAYGTAESGQEITVNASDITANPAELQIGQTLYSNSGMAGKVRAIDGNVVTIFLQHPLAGKTLQFSVKVVDIQKKQ